MKRLLTLLLATAALATTAQAQISREDARRVILGGGNDNNRSRNDRDVVVGGDRNDYPYNGSRQAEVDRVNREYDAKIQSIRNNGYLSNEEKQRAIRQLERDRQQRLRQLTKGYDRRGDRDEDDRYDRRRHDNGKHKGWYKNKKNRNWKKGHRHRDDDNEQ